MNIVYPKPNNSIPEYTFEKFLPVSIIRTLLVAPSFVHDSTKLKQQTLTEERRSIHTVVKMNELWLLGPPKMPLINIILTGEKNH